MVELLEGINHWHWLALGLALLAVELLGTAGYFLWFGISALAVGLLLSLMSFAWPVQWSAFAAFSLATTWIWWRRQLKHDKQSDASRDLNQKQKQLVGQELILEEDIQVGMNRIRIADTTWSAKSDSAILAGSKVKIARVDGIILTIEVVE
ncbi:NfeD family protein [Vibrio navarrensis]|uniref:NfeD family protein n=1 Tax=Vibrio navarrensis TaxID=29495 RepID=A0AAI9CUM4_9VIBR|nr:NfeD family protein [Vibrio navarrensis]EJL6394496.1 NfeD family protein [Vibrio navarrensis]EKA5635474.1 NfeD family protein [Vibrio navarrensis]ELN6932965.1 NfeD family protein [Vibrio navarrensis]